MKIYGIREAMAILAAILVGICGWRMSAQEAVHAQNIENVRYADQFTGADIFARAIAAFSDCSNACRVVIPAGTYNNVTTSLIFPVIGNGTAALTIETGVIINYIGSGYAIDANGNGQGNVNLRIDGGGRVIGTSAGLGCVRLRKFNRGAIYDLNCENFTNGDGFYDIGANDIAYYNISALNNKNGVHNVGSGDGYTANAVLMAGGRVKGNSQWGVFEDVSGGGAGTGSNINNSYVGMTAEQNGTSGKNSGNFFIQGGADISILNSYFEYGSGNTVYQNVKIGDGTNYPAQLSISRCFFSSPGTTSTILNYGLATSVDGNTEVAANPNFFEQVSGSANTLLGRNYMSSTNPMAGTATGYELLTNAQTGARIYAYPIGAMQFQTGGATWTAASGAPSAGCTNGSLYSRTDIGELYVCQGGTWVTK